MASTTTPMIPQVQQQFETLLTAATRLDQSGRRADQVELDLFRQLLHLGAGLLQLYFDTQAAVRPAEPIHAPDGTRLRCHDRRSRRYRSIFGTLTIQRHAFTAPDHAVVCPLDARLSLPEHGYSALLREWCAYAGTDSAYRETQTVLERILGLTLSVQALETMLAEDAVDLAAFDTRSQPQPQPQPQPPALVAAPPDATVTGAPDASILVAQADGKGVPMVLQDVAARSVRPSSGRPANRMKEAIVTALYTVAPYPRTPEQIVSALLGPSDADQSVAGLPAARPRPVDKQVRATLDGKTAAVTRLADAARRRMGPTIQERIALTDGAEALQNQLLETLPEHTLILDIIHATEYLWDAANALLGERHPERLDWMRVQLTALVRGQTDQVIATLAAAQTEPGCPAGRRDALERTIRYYRRNQPWMRYDQYLARGWPIGTGVVEGACGHLVKDRLQQAGMRWTIAGAQPVLDLRAVRLSGEWDAYWSFHHQQQHQRRYGTQADACRPLDTRWLPQLVAA